MECHSSVPRRPLIQNYLHRTTGNTHYVTGKGPGDYLPERGGMRPKGPVLVSTLSEREPALSYVAEDTLIGFRYVLRPTQ
jgi:hypothetical protein